MRISEFISTLQDRLQRHGDVEVEATWESITRSLEPDNVYLSRSGELFIDADENYYKKTFAVDPKEGEPAAPLESPL